MSVALTGADTLSIGATAGVLRILNDFADGDVANLDFQNNLVEMKTGKNGNIIYAFNSTGKNVTMLIRVLLASSDDKFLNAQMNEYLNDPASYTLLEGEFIKRTGDGLGNVNNVVYRVNGGIVQKFPNAKDNVEGDTESSVAIYQLIFGNTARSIT